MNIIFVIYKFILLNELLVKLVNMTGYMIEQRVQIIKKYYENECSIVKTLQALRPILRQTRWSLKVKSATLGDEIWNDRVG